MRRPAGPASAEHPDLQDGLVLLETGDVGNALDVFRRFNREPDDAERPDFPGIVRRKGPRHHVFAVDAGEIGVRHIQRSLHVRMDVRRQRRPTQGPRMASRRQRGAA